MSAEGEVTRPRVPVMSILGLGVDAANGARLRIGGGDGTLWESVDGGENWSFVAGLRSDAPFLYRVVFDPSDLDHIIVGTGVKGAFVTHDGGVSWSASTGLPATGMNVFNGVISPADGEVVWIMGIDLAESDAADNSLRKTHNDYGDINSIAFSPASSSVMYFGLESEQGVH